jgi:hypothetical protein
MRRKNAKVRLAAQQESSHAENHDERDA